MLWLDPIRCGCAAAGSFLVGTWLSLVEHSLGVRGVGSSNLPVPTIQFALSADFPIARPEPRKAL
jgi:hypothetical protein